VWPFLKEVLDCVLNSGVGVRVVGVRVVGVRVVGVRSIGMRKEKGGKENLNIYIPQSSESYGYIFGVYGVSLIGWRKQMTRRYDTYHVEVANL
jgi:hypothetical protein